MRREAGKIIPLLAAVLAGLLVAPVARADFYTLDGKFACLEAGEGSCANHSRDTLTPPKPTDPSEASTKSDHDPLLRAPVTLTTSAPPTTPREPVQDIASRIAAGKPSSDDMRRLKTLSRSGDGRAIELLAWCDYFGIGAPRDPVAAYIMYGIAALAGVAGASANQAVIYEYVLTPDQRQMVLDIQNDDIDIGAVP